MNKNVLVISTSLRSQSNSEALADEFVRGAVAAGHNVEKISLRGKEIHFCRGCLACQHTGRCVISDDMQDIIPKMHDADAIVFATPIYYYEMCGQMKTLLDRANALYGSDYRFRDIYLLTTAAEAEEDTPRRAEIGLTGWIDCFGKASLKGHLFCGGVADARDIEGNTCLPKAYEMGKGV